MVRNALCPCVCVGGGGRLKCWMQQHLNSEHL